jgi:hypothetical protein
MTSFETRARELAAEYEYDIPRLEFQHRRRAFGSFTLILTGAPEIRDLFARALAISRQRASTVRVKHRIVVEVEAPHSRDDTAIIAEAFAELRRTLEAHGYSPKIDYGKPPQEL